LKADHPRAIDQYIDFFGDGGGARPETLAPPPWLVHQRPALERNDLPARDDGPRP